MKNPKDYKIDLIQKCIDDDNFLNKIKERNYKIAQNFSIQKNVDETLKVINETFN